MKTKTLKQRIMIAFTGVIVIMCVCILALGVYVLKQEIYNRTEAQVGRSLDSARTFYQEEINRIGVSLQSANQNTPTDDIKNKFDLDYLYRISAEQAASVQSEIVHSVLETGQAKGGTRIISIDELAGMNADVQERSRIKILDTPKARPTTLTLLNTAMAKEYALPLKDDSGTIKEIIYAGRIINRDNALVDRIRKLVFGDELYKNKPVGTVTIFQDDVRVSTNVLDAEGHRAIGTRISEEVYHKVVEENGTRWLDRAFVVTHWYMTAYEPIRNISGDVIGILYVGTLEEPFNDMLVRILIAFVVIILAASGFAFLLSLLLTGSIVRPITEMLQATQKIAGGQLDQEVSTHTSIREMEQLAGSFNEMSSRIREREASVKLSNEKLTELNKSYLDLLGFVAHELKGLLSSAVINAYSLRDGLLGMINFKQKKAVDSICRNLDYLDATVKKFLNLSRIERGNLEINKTEFNLKKDVFDLAIDTFSKLQAAKQMKIENQIAADLDINADRDLMQIVANNLVNNAIKYGTESGQVLLSSRDKGEFVTIEVYNDSRPISEEMVEHLFKKFSRLDVPEKKKVKGTGLGLYITKQIVESHGGTIRVEPRDHGNAFIFTVHKE